MILERKFHKKTSDVFETSDANILEISPNGRNDK